jgi:MATE family multidrug resistance protein
MVPDLFLAGFFGGRYSADDRELIYPLAVRLLWFVAGYNLLDAVAMVFVSAIKGAGDTMFVLITSAVMCVLLTGGSWLAVEVWRFDIYGCWAIISGWIALMGVVFLLRFLGGKWRSMRVIEQGPSDLPA